MHYPVIFYSYIHSSPKKMYQTFYSLFFLAVSKEECVQTYAENEFCMDIYYMPVQHTKKNDRGFHI